MKIEQRNVYIAEDGEEFDSEESCRSHERAKALSKFIYDLLYDNTDLSGDCREEVAEVVAGNIITILAAYNKL